MYFGGGQNAVVQRGTEAIRAMELQDTLSGWKVDLRNSKAQLIYLLNLSSDTNGATALDRANDECVVCQDTIARDVAVLPCGHSFWYVRAVVFGFADVMPSCMQ